MREEPKKDRGFLTFAQNGSEDYLRMAYALALSLKATQKGPSGLTVGVTPGMVIPDHYREVFDEVIDIPWLDEARNSEWKLENEWKAYHFTPYRETIKLDADMLFTSDLGPLWDRLALQDMVCCTEVESYRGVLATSDFYRKTFTANALPNIYTAFMYFKYSETAQRVFEEAQMIFHNWERYFETFLEPDTRPSIVSTDVVFALAIKVSDLIDECTLPPGLGPRFVHMKSRMQNWPEQVPISEDWTKHLSASVSDDLNVKIGHYRQTLPVHYHNKSFLTDEVIETYRKAI